MVPTRLPKGSVAEVPPCGSCGLHPAKAYTHVLPYLLRVIESEVCTAPPSRGRALLSPLIPLGRTPWAATECEKT